MFYIGKRIMIQMRPLNRYLCLLIVSIFFSKCFTLPTWPRGVGFGNGAIDLGGLLICEIKNFTQIWRADEGGPNNTGVTFYEPSTLPDGFYMLGSYIQSNNNSLPGWVLAGKEVRNGSGILKSPIDYNLVLESTSLTINQNGGTTYIWHPTAPEGYVVVCSVITMSPEKPPLDKIRCVRSDFAVFQENGSWIWGANDSTYNSFNMYSSIAHGGGVPTGTFFVQNTSVPYLKNVDGNVSSMSNVTQIDDLMKRYSPVIHFHPDEEFLPSSVDWFFSFGGILFTRGQDGNPVIIGAPGYDNLPQGGSNDGLYWIDLVYDADAKAKVKAGNLQSATAYLHVKPSVGGTCTDIVIFIFYPFNGAAKAKVLLFHINFMKLGEHVGDWEHVTLRVSNFDGQLKSVYFSQHNKGIWVDKADLEYIYDEKPNVYSSLHGHASYPRAGENLMGEGDVGLVNKAAIGSASMDTSSSYTIISASYLNPPIAEPYWLNYAREWGPKVMYDIPSELNKLSKFIPGKLKKLFRKILFSLPSEILGEEGPLGPKYKDNWDGDERA